MEGTHGVSKQHACVAAWSSADPLHELPLIVLALIILLDRSQITIVFLKAIISITATLVFVLTVTLPVLSRTCNGWLTSSGKRAASGDSSELVRGVLKPDGSPRRASMELV
jgi:hypothetical protein